MPARSPERPAASVPPAVDPRPGASAIADPEALLTPDQRAQLPLLTSLCSVAISGGGDSLTPTTGSPAEQRFELGCRCCPPFDECPPAPANTLERRDDHAVVYGLRTHTFGAFTNPGADELAATFWGCEDHPGNWGGTLLLRRSEQKWVRTAYHSGVNPRTCWRLREQDGHDVLLCEIREGQMVLDLVVLDFHVEPSRGHGDAQGAGLRRTEVAELWETSGVDCEAARRGDPAPEIVHADVDRVSFERSKSGGAELAIELLVWHGSAPRAFVDECLALEDAPDATSKPDPHRLLPTRRVRLDYVIQGGTVRATAATERTLHEERLLAADHP